MSDNPHVMSKYATEIDCLRTRDKWHQQRIAELERENAELREALETIRLATCDYTTGTRAGLASAHKLATDALKQYTRAAIASEKENERG